MTTEKELLKTDQDTAYWEVVDGGRNGILGVEGPLVHCAEAISIRGRYNNVDHEVTEHLEAFDRSLAAHGVQVLCDRKKVAIKK